MERDAETKRIALMTHDSWESNSSNEKSPNNFTVKSNLTDGTEEEFKVYIIDRKFSPITWIEAQFQKQREKDVQAMNSAKTRIIEGFGQIKKEVKSMDWGHCSDNLGSFYCFYLARKNGRNE